MPTGILDSFQIVVALYLFYIAFKGSGQMYRFGDMDEVSPRKAAVQEPQCPAGPVGAEAPAWVKSAVPEVREGAHSKHA